jgi:hypothetical protein
MAGALDVRDRGNDPGGGRIGVMNYPVLPPEVNSSRMFTGAGPGPMLAAAAWGGLSAELSSAA